MILETAHCKVAHIVGEALQSRDGEGTHREVVVGEVLSIDSDEERAIPDAKSDLEELAAYKGELALGLLIIAGKAGREGKIIEYRQGDQERSGGLTCCPPAGSYATLSSCRSSRGT